MCGVYVVLVRFNSQDVHLQEDSDIRSNAFNVQSITGRVNLIVSVQDSNANYCFV